MSTGIRILLTILSAGLGVLVFEPIGWWWLAILSWAPLILALRDAKPSHGLYLGILHGVIFYGVTMSWLVNIFKETPHMAIPLVLILALFTGFFSRCYAIAHARYKQSYTTAIFAATWWVAVEFFRAEIFYLKFPWMTPGVGFGPMPLSPWLGVYGISFFLILGSALICQTRTKRLLGLLLLITMLLSHFIPKGDLTTDNPIKVMAVQGESVPIDRYAELTRSSDTKVDLIVWPEYSIPADVRRNNHQWQSLIKLAEEKKAVMVIGTQTSHEIQGWHNTALTFNERGTLGEHYKNHTVHFFDDGMAGTHSTSIETPLGKVGTPICFDCDYEDVIRRMVTDGAEFLAIPSMDAEHWTRREHLQHAELFRHRAAENGRWMVVAATSGTTQIIDPRGKRVSSLPLIEEGILIGDIYKQSQKTFYTRAGWIFPWAMMFTGIAWLIILFFLSFKHKNAVTP